LPASTAQTAVVERPGFDGASAKVGAFER